MPLTENSSLYDKWLFAIKHLGDLDEQPAKLKEAIVNRLFDQAEIAKYSPQDRQEYEESLKNFRDWYSCLVTAERKGRAEDHTEGLAEGRAEGRKEEKLSIARKLKSSGTLTIQQIAQVAQLTDSEVEGA